MQPEMPLHRLKGGVRLGNVTRFFVVHEHIVPEKVVVHPLGEPEVAVVLPPVEPPEFFYRVRIPRADCNDARDWMCERFVGYQWKA